MKKIPIAELQPGMYVTQVTKQNGQVEVKTKGWAKTDKIITQLKLKGVLEVAIDPDKTIIDETEEKADSELPETAKEVVPFKTQTVEKELKKARKLYDEAQQLQKKALGDIQAGRKIDVKPIQEFTSSMIDSIFRNQDALTCMTRIREKDAYLYEHSLNVSILMAMFARHLDMDKEQIEMLSQAAFLHDMGKILIPDEILHKPGKLTDDEFKIMREHVNYGIKTLAETPGIPAELIEIVGMHHEKLNGTGYPNGLKAEQITQAGRMITIVDIYDAMTAERVYKKGMLPSAAFKIMQSMVPDEIDGNLLHQFIRCVGVHPVGTLVKLKSGKLAIVTESNQNNPLKPIVKIFYNANHNHHTEIKDLDLSKAYVNDAIESSIKPEKFKIELNKFMREVLIGN
ncbi:HD-GYP domain-containing protein [Catenovulum maritimum]|uniref:Phosphodiesterase n=1 Tax=Catenovulum maritimum TaxID=1513271 RepID=A0A0J8JLW3_9ALTE|nr:HD-GYP domain-containing protein [Catenovulum maritimum]KMT65546.1 phosphodiesterase [Catenovulum maritimum]